MIKTNLPALSADQMREVDRLMVDDYNISLEQIMENAGRNLADLAIEILSSHQKLIDQSKIVIACGAGNNGGGGMVAARFLSNRGVSVTVVLAVREASLKPIPAQRWKTLQQILVTTIVANSSDPTGVFNDADLVIDAIIGYGLKGSPRGIPAHVIMEILNSQNPNVLALDVPSGLDADSGPVGDVCIQAKATMTLALPKIGLLLPTSKVCVGNLYLADIGVPPELYTKLGFPPQFLFTEETLLLISDPSNRNI